MRHPGEFLEEEAGCCAHSSDDLAAIHVKVQQLKEDLLDFNPMLAVMAEGLQKAVALELASQRCNLFLLKDAPDDAGAPLARNYSAA